MFTKDEAFMQQALNQAKLAEQMQEVPIGAIVTYQNKIIATGFNCCITNLDPTAHAEIIAIRNAALAIKNYRLIDLSLYVTVEPCAMCFGALLQARIKRLVFGAKDSKFGAIESIINLNDYKWNHKIQYIGGVLEKDCAAILQKFFRAKRK